MSKSDVSHYLVQSENVSIEVSIWQTLSDLISVIRGGEGSHSRENRMWVQGCVYLAVVSPRDRSGE